MTELRERLSKYAAWSGEDRLQRRSRRVRAVRGRTLSTKRTSLTALERLGLDAKDGKRRHLPMTRGDCVDGPRPCAFVSCRWHLYVDVAKAGIKLNFPDVDDLEQLDATCALDVAELGGATLEQVGAVMNVTRERVRQLEERAMKKLARRLRFIEKLELDDLVPLDSVQWFGERW